ncbi:MAG: hypothetical protein ABR929_07305 [Roseiarcus sp.]|jgi:hypothetical protein
MSGECHILCAKCRAPVKLTIDATWMATMSCPICGRSETFFAAVDEANAQFADCLARQANGGGAGDRAESRRPSYRFAFTFSPR